jgi:p-aminobenzoyl-glutamate transporter AbgT
VRLALCALIACVIVIALLTFPPGAPLRDQQTGAIVGNSPYQKDDGVGTFVTMMLPYCVAISVVWILLFLVWEVLGRPFGAPGDSLASIGR